MKKALEGRRVPWKVGQDEEEPSTAEASPDTAQPALKRPTVKPRKSTNLRKSFTPSALTDEKDAGETSGVITPRRNNVARIAIQRNAAKRAVELPPRRSEDEGEDSRPSYDAASLNELKASTPSTPRDFASADEGDTAVLNVSEGTRELDLSSKFGSSLSRYQQQQIPSVIPSAAEIAEKKARRARLAQEQAAEEYMSLDPDDPGVDNNDDDNVTTDTNGRLVLKPKDKWNEAERRLIKEDEDILENFEDFTEDGKIHLGRKAEKEAAKRRKEDMAAQVAAAEGSDSDDEDSDASEKERNAAFEAAQTRHGTYAATHHATPSDPYEHLRPKTPPKISPLPTLDGVLERLRRQLSEMQSSRAQKLQEMTALQREKVRLAEEEVRIQKALRETAEKFQELRREKGIAGTGAPAVEAPAGLLEASAAQSETREQLVDDAADGEVLTMGLDGGRDEEDDQMDEAAATGHMGLGFADMSAAPGLGMSRPPAKEDDW